MLFEYLHMLIRYHVKLNIFKFKYGNFRPIRKRRSVLVGIHVGIKIGIKIGVNQISTSRKFVVPIVKF